MKHSRILLNKTIVSKDGAINGIYSSIDWCLRHWDKTYPIDPLKFLIPLNIKIRTIGTSKQVFVFDAATKADPNDPIIYTRHDLSLTLPYPIYKLVIAREIHFFLTKQNSFELNRNSDEFIKGEINAIKMLLPDEHLARFLTTNKKTDYQLIQMFDIPAEIFHIRKEKVIKKYKISISDIPK